MTKKSEFEQAYDCGFIQGLNKAISIFVSFEKLHDDYFKIVEKIIIERNEKLKEQLEEEND
jgi:hypothetical protein